MIGTKKAQQIIADLEDKHISGPDVITVVQFEQPEAVGIHQAARYVGFKGDLINRRVYIFKDTWKGVLDRSRPSRNRSSSCQIFHTITVYPCYVELLELQRGFYES